MNALFLALLFSSVSQSLVLAAQTATILPVGFDAEGNHIEGEIVGTGVLSNEGVLDTTYILSGETAGNLFTLTLAEGGGDLAETVAVPALGIDDEVACDFTADNAAVCQINHGGTAVSILTADFTLEDIPVSTRGAVAPAPTPITSALPRPSSSPTVLPSSTVVTRTTISPSSASSAAISGIASANSSAVSGSTGVGITLTGTSSTANVTQGASGDGTASSGASSGSSVISIGSSSAGSSATLTSATTTISVLPTTPASSSQILSINVVMFFIIVAMPFVTDLWYI